MVDGEPDRYRGGSLPRPAPTSAAATDSRHAGTLYQEVSRVRDQAELLYDTARVEAALDAMAEAITLRLSGRRPVVLCVMSGGLVPTAALLSRLDFALELDYIHATRYREGLQGGRLEWVARPRTPLVGRMVLVVDDILDEGMTLDGILGWARGQGVAGLYSAVLVDKQGVYRPGVASADFTGLTVGNRYVFGYGMDYKGYWRNLRGIYAAVESPAQAG